MSDLPVQGLLQQMNAQSHSGEYLEVLGKRAAAHWSNGEYKTLTDAVTQTVKQAQLSPEQVRRVVEFANTSAYLDEFKKEGTTHRVIDFPGGPADVSEILRDLNDGGGGTVFDRGTSDYDSAPSEVRKEASFKAEEELLALFGKSAEADLPYANPHEPVIDLRDKLAGAAEHLRAQISGLEVMYADLGDSLYQQVKQAALAGTPLGHIMQAWESVTPSDAHIKEAFAVVTPRLLEEGVFRDVSAMTGSIDKTASAKIVNPTHPLVQGFSDFAETLSKLAELHAAYADVQEHLASTGAYIKTAESWAEKAYDATTGAARRAGQATHPFVEKALGTGAANVAKGLITYAPHAALGIGAAELYTHLKHSPNPVARAARGTGNLILRNIPGTEEYYQHQYDAASGGPHGY